MPAKLIDAALPDFGAPTSEPIVSAGTYRGRAAALIRRAAETGFDAIVIYGDREHAANIAWATGYDPRFEEAIYVAVPGRRPHLLVGNEGWFYAPAAKGEFERVLWQHVSLLGQPRDRLRPLVDLFSDAGLVPGMRIGVAGWKYREREDGRADPDWLEVPHYLVDTLRLFGIVANAGDLLMNPRDGLRAVNEVDQLACFEFSATRGSNALRALIHGARPGMSEHEAVRLMGLDGAPHSVHLMLSSGPRTKDALLSPSMRKLERGDAIVCAFGLMGALNCRAGFLVAEANELPAGIRDYVEKLVAPYFEAVAAWYETIGIGVTGGELYDAVMGRLSDPFFGISLNPGHLIHLDEWVNSPIRQESDVPLVSGMAIQCDIIPATGTAYFMSNIEDGIALADEPLRRSFAASYPEAWSRIERRRAFMQDVLGIRLKPEVLPFSNIPAWLPPFWLAPDRVMARR
jgi:hypothetical protein